MSLDSLIIHIARRYRLTLAHARVIVALSGIGGAH